MSSTISFTQWLKDAHVGERLILTEQDKNHGTYLSTARRIGIEVQVEQVLIVYPSVRKRVNPHTITGLCITKKTDKKLIRS